MKYPYIGKSKNNTEILFTSDEYGFCIDGGASSTGNQHHNNFVGKYSGDWAECNFKNITAEYLANTYGEVKSKEHAEFIVRLCENAGFKIDANTDEPKSFMVYDDFFGIYSVKYSQLANGIGRERITIPLPPECERKTPSKEDIKEYLMEQGLTSLSAGEVTDNICEARQLEDATINHVDEWPKVGDDVLICDNYNHDELKDFNGKICRVIGICVNGVSNVYTIEKDGGVAAIYYGDWIKKPKTPEQELRNELSEEFCTAGYDTGRYIDILMSKYNITKKPQ